MGVVASRALRVAREMREVANRFLEQVVDVIIEQGVVHVAPVPPAGDQAEVA